MSGSTIEKGSGVSLIRGRNVVKLSDARVLTKKKNNFKRKPSSKYVEIIMTGDEIKRLLGGRISGVKLLKKEKIDYPKYLYNHINASNLQRRATIPSKVGKVHQFYEIRKFRTMGEWKKYHEKNFPGSLKRAEAEIIEDLRSVGVSASYLKKWRPFIKAFVEELVIKHTFRGLKIQEAILIKISEMLGQEYRWSDASTDSKGIDGFVGDIPISIKPNTCAFKKPAGVKRVYYKINENKGTVSFSMSF